MDLIQQLVAWFASGTFTSVIAALSLIVTGATAIAALTPTPADDSALLWARKVIDFLAGNVLHNK